jgi:hypothetical protein
VIEWQAKRQRRNRLAGYLLLIFVGAVIVTLAALL